MADEAPVLPVVVVDGTEAPDQLDFAPTVAVPCPVCGDPVGVDAVDVVRTGPRLIDDPARAVAGLLAMDLLEWDGITYLRGLRRTDAHGLATRCPSCDSDLVAVAAAGEVQPSRYQVVLHGLVPATSLPPPAGADAPASRPSSPTAVGATPTPTPRWQVAVVVLAVAAFAAIPVWLNWRALDAWLESRAIASSGVPTVARVVEAESSRGGPRSVDTFEITYRYSVADGGQADTFTVTRNVDAATFAVFAEAEEIEIRYDPGDPGRSDVARNDAATTGLALALLVDAMLVLATIQIVRHARRDLHSA